MTIFEKYSKYYDLFYKDKDYVSEVDYICDLVQKNHIKADTILSLGCGTGRHDILLAERGYSVTGVDLSEEMLAFANVNASKIKNARLRPLFLHGDVKNFRIGKTFSLVLALFHVMSYQTSNEDLLATFATAKAHLKPDGIFIFDCWYGPAVLANQPSVRLKRIRDQQIDAIRICEPVLYPNANCVDVNYQVLIIDGEKSLTDVIHETHRMRYLFMPEIDDLIARSGMVKLFVCESMTGKEPGLNTWGVCVGVANR